MCAGDDRNCPDFELHRQKLRDELDSERRSFLKSAFVATGGAAALTAGGLSLIPPAMAQTAAARHRRQGPQRAAVLQGVNFARAREGEQSGAVPWPLPPPAGL
jgi:hypothetical protein